MLVARIGSNWLFEVQIGVECSLEPSNFSLSESERSPDLDEFGQPVQPESRTRGPVQQSASLCCVVQFNPSNSIFLLDYTFFFFGCTSSPSNPEPMIINS